MGNVEVLHRVIDIQSQLDRIEKNIVNMGSGMSLNEYQEAAMTTCMPSCDNFSYMSLNLVGEVGELMSKVAKHIRKGKIEIKDNRIASYPDTLTPAEVQDIKAEAGDILWQLSGLCKVMGWPLEEVAKENLAKLASRKQRGVIDGNGDNR